MPSWDKNETVVVVGQAQPAKAVNTVAVSAPAKTQPKVSAIRRDWKYCLAVLELLKVGGLRMRLIFHFLETFYYRKAEMIQILT